MPRTTPTVDWTKTPGRILLRVIAATLLGHYLSEQSEYWPSAFPVVPGASGVKNRRWFEPAAQKMLPDLLREFMPEVKLGVVKSKRDIYQRLWGRAYTPFMDSKKGKESPQTNRISAPFYIAAVWLVDLYIHEGLTFDRFAINEVAEAVVRGAHVVTVLAVPAGKSSKQGRNVAVACDLAGAALFDKEEAAPDNFETVRDSLNASFKRVILNRDNEEAAPAPRNTGSRVSPRSETRLPPQGYRQQDLIDDRWIDDWLDCVAYSRGYLRSKGYWPCRLYADRRDHPAVLYLTVSQSKRKLDYSINRAAAEDLYLAFQKGRVKQAWVVFVERDSEGLIVATDRLHIVDVWRQIEPLEPLSSLEGLGDFHWLPPPADDPDDVL